MGAVMGSKNVKAIAARGTLDIDIADPDKYLTYYLKTLRKLMSAKWAQALSRDGTPLLFRACNALGFLSVNNNQRTTVGDAGTGLHVDALHRHSSGMLSCYACPVHCRHRYDIKEGTYAGTRGEGPEYGSIGSLGPKLGILDLDSVIALCELSNYYGLDTMSMGSYLAWIMELYQRGVITRDMTRLDLGWGNVDAVMELVRQIAERRVI